MYLDRVRTDVTRYTRRRALRRAAGAAAVVGVGGLAGCLGGAGASGGGDSGSGSGSDADADSNSGATDGTDTATATGTPVPGGRVSVGADALGNHPSAQGLEGQPAMGDVGSATGVVLAFEDPSCPRCAAFERGTGARIRSELVPTGEVAFVARTIPVVYPWGEQAVPAMEATFDRDAGAFWDLLDFYLASQGDISSRNVLDRTESFLAANTDVDAAGVLADVESGAFADAVEVDVAASEAADVSGTPTVFLFRDGEYRTRATGSVSFELVTGALGL